MRKTKIVCTIGPASDSEDVIRQLLEAGLNVARLNLSHGSHESHGASIARFRKVRDELELAAAVLLDTKGPEIRIGDFESSVTVVPGQSYVFTTDKITGDGQRCNINYAPLPSELKAGDTILVDDGEISFRVESTGDKEINCTVIDGGIIKSRKGVNVPGVKLAIPFLNENDKKDLLFGIAQDVDYIAASFVRRADDVRQMRDFLAENGGQSIRIISKIENSEGVERFEEILKESDGIMVARGDMGVEVPFELLPGIQKRMITSCCRAGKTVITATQMLDSMEDNRRPTRAEISDVANAVFDGSSAVMLSGETASGKYPVEAVTVMAKIIEQAEADAMRPELHKEIWLDRDHGDNTNAVSAAACTLAEQIGAAAIISETSTGRAARRVAKYRPSQSILAATPDRKVYHQLSLYWGVYPMMVRSMDSVDVLFHCTLEIAQRLGYVKSGDKVVLTAGIPLNTSGSTNMLKVQLVE